MLSELVVPNTQAEALQGRALHVTGCAGFRAPWVKWLLGQPDSALPAPPAAALSQSVRTEILPPSQLHIFLHRVEDSTLLVPARVFVWGASGVKLAAPGQTGRCVAQPGMQRDQQLQKEGKLPFQLQRVHVSPTGGLSGSPPGEAIKPQEC